MLLVCFDKYTRPEFPSGPGVIPIFPVTRQFEYISISCSQTQFPLRLVYAITVYKSQGFTLLRVVLNLEQKEHCLRLLYVAVSKVKTLTGLLFEGSFNFDHFSNSRSVTQQERELDYVFRSRHLIQ
jgi:ATP-dependent DNA helicase PIF1